MASAIPEPRRFERVLRAGMDDREVEGRDAGQAAAPLPDIQRLMRELRAPAAALIEAQVGGTTDRGAMIRCLIRNLPSLLAEQGVELNEDLRRMLATRIAVALANESEGRTAGDGAAARREAEPAGEAADVEESAADTRGPAPTVVHVFDGATVETLSAEREAQEGRRRCIEDALKIVQPRLLDQMDVEAVSTLQKEQLSKEVAPLVDEILSEARIYLNRMERQQLVENLLHEMLGLGPLEPLLADDSVTDILVNRFDQTYVERGGKLKLSEVRFRDNAHVLQIAQRIVSAVGRRIDESVPLVDARLADGSRVNVIIGPLALDGPSISIRKFAKRKITLDVMSAQQNISPAMATVLKIAARARLNILISGGTGSGKTTLLNAMSQMIDSRERIVTIEDAAELQLQQPHVVRLETRPANLEKQGEITMRHLVKNSLRMRPDRIILGEIRSGEAIDMLQAMNTGHDGSLSTVHANRPREALMRLENMVAMSGIELSPQAVRTQIASAVDMIVQVSRMRDGVRRVTNVTEVVGMEGDVITTQDLFTFKFTGEDSSGKLLGEFVSAGVRPHFTERAEYFGLDKALLEAL